MCMQLDPFPDRAPHVLADPLEDSGHACVIAR
jgi:hypothetical protein